MLWQQDAGYAEWYDTPQGQGALAAQNGLLRRAVSAWPRRGRKLLEMNCGGGRFLEELFTAGFDVSGHEANYELFRQAKRRLGQRAELVAGSAELLPFEDNSFSYVACLHCFEALELAAGGRVDVKSFQPMLREAVRLAEHGVLLGFYSRYSLAGLREACAANSRRTLPWMSPSSVLRLLYKNGCASDAQLSLSSTLLTPRTFWDGRSLLRKNRQTGRFSLTACNCPLPLGAFVIIRLDFGPALGLTGLPVRAAQFEAARPV